MAPAPCTYDNNMAALKDQWRRSDKLSNMGTIALTRVGVGHKKTSRRFEKSERRCHWAGWVGNRACTSPKPFASQV